MRDPYDVLGLKRGATIEEIKAAYRRLSKQRHPDYGGTNEAMSELNVAYHFILDELKRQYHEEEQREARQRKAHAEQNEWRDVGAGSSSQNRREKWWRDRYREIDEELETLRRYAEQQDEQLRRMREAAWRTGHRADWAQLTIEDILRFFKSIARSGLKGVALLFAALVGIGSILVEANVVSAIIMLGSVIGVLASLAIKSEKGGMMSAALLLFGVMTLWLPPVRNALFTFPLATISVLILLGLIFKFTQAGGTVGFATGGVLALYVLFVILGQSAQRPEVVTIIPPAPHYSPSAAPPFEPSPSPMQTFSYAPAPPTATPATTQPDAPPEPLTLLASDGAILKFAAGVTYRVKVRAGERTSLRATSGMMRVATDTDASRHCVNSLNFLPEPGAGPWREVNATYRACDGDAIVRVRSGK